MLFGLPTNHDYRHRSAAIFGAGGIIALLLLTPFPVAADAPEFQNEEFDSSSLCVDESYARYEELVDCEANCDECALDDELCWSCKSQPEPQEKLSLWSRIKNWFAGIFSAVKNFFTGSSPEEPDPLKSELNIAWQTAKTAGTSVFAYGKGEARGEEARIDQELKDAIAAADDIGALLKLRSLFLMYCSDKHEGDHEAEQACRAEFMKEFKKRGDVIKERLFAEIDPEDASGDTYQKIVQLRSLLMAGENAEGEGVWFSTDNIKKVNAGLKAKMKQWFVNALLNAELGKLHQWYALARAYMFPQESGPDIGGGLFEGANPVSNVQYRGRRLALRQMLKIDICNPNQDELKKFQDMLASPGCEKLLGNADACKYIAAGNLEAAYARLYEQDRGDDANNLPQNQAPEPIDCTKPATTENSTETEPETSAPVPEPAEPTPAIDDTDDGPVSSEPGETEGEPEPQPPATAPEPEPQIPPTAAEPEIEPEPEPEPISTDPEPEPTPPPPSAEPEPEPEPEPPPTEPCDIIISENPITGWDYSLQNCNGTYSQAMMYFMECGWHPPFVQAEESEPETMCYETGGGFIEYEMIIPCHPLPPPDPPIVDCVRMRLAE